MTHDDAMMTKIENPKLLKTVQNRSDMTFKGILHHMAKFKINWPSLRAIFGNLKKMKQGMIRTDENLLERDENRTTNCYFTS